ncbi:MAG TPA: type II toxin-antitoxin system RelE/ParE family toxin [Lacipirellulaceae bacterium]|nr:type II toxin-antitoxin system RelE/ParE family toxin [Lacipirellulaceae bacterium]
MYKVDLSKKAEQFYRRTDRPLARKLARWFEQLERDPRNHNNVKPLSGKLAGTFRYRVGDHRVLYQIDDLRKTVFIVSIAHRGEAYN